MAMTAPAYASSSRTVSYGGTARGSASFDSHGEVIKVKDLRKDGRWVSVTASWDSEVEQCANTKGSGTTVTCNWSIPEGKKVEFELIATKGGEELPPRVTWSDRA